MISYRRFISALTAFIICTAFCSCGGEKEKSTAGDTPAINNTDISASSAENDSENETSGVISAETSTVPPETENISGAGSISGTEKNTTAETTSAAVSENKTPEDTTSPAEKTSSPSQETTSSAPEQNNAPTEADGYKQIFTEFHKVYLSSEKAEDIYALFSPSEIEAFNKYMSESLSNSGYDTAKVFDKEEFIKAIDKSIENINGFKTHYGADGDIWVLNVTDQSYKKIPEEQLNDFRTQLGLNITDGYILEMPFYYDKSNEESFVAEPASALCIDGKWYL